MTIKPADVLVAAELLRIITEIREDLLPEWGDATNETDRRGILKIATLDGGGKFHIEDGGDGGGMFVVIGSELLRVAAYAVIQRAEAMLAELGVEIEKPVTVQDFGELMQLAPKGVLSL